MKALFLLLCISLCLGVSAQKKYLDIPFAFDVNSQRLDSLLKEYSKRKDYKSLIYKTDCDTCIHFFVLVIFADNKTNYWCMQDSTIIKTGELSSDAIFRYKDYSKAGVTQKEDLKIKLKFVAPTIGGDGIEDVIYRDKIVSFYFELGKDITDYTEDPSKIKYRKEWLTIIRDELKYILNE